MDNIVMLSDVDRFLKLSVLAKTTRSLYGHYLFELSVWLDAAGLDYAALDAMRLLDWMGEHPAWSESTRHTAISAAQSFYRWRFGDRHDVLNVRVKRHKSKRQRVLSEASLDILTASFDTTRPKGIRDLAITMLLLDTGLRASEATSIRLSDLDMQTWTLQVIIKGGDYAQVSFFDYTASCLSAWLPVRERLAKPAADSLFIALGGSNSGKPMTGAGLRMIYRKLGLACGIGLISPHDFRRTFATMAHRNGAPTRIVQVAGRWKDIRQVQRYTEDLTANDLAPYSPVNRLMGI